EGLRSQTGYRRRPGRYGGKPPVASPNHLERRFNVAEPNKVWVTDITYIRTYEGWLYLAVVLDLFSRQVIGWSMKPQMTSDLAIDALLMAVWRRKPKQEVMIHSDQGSQFSSGDWQSFLKANNLLGSMSRRGNCHDNAVAESFFQLLKRERIKRKIYSARQDARADVFDYIEMFYNPKRRHGFNNQLSPVASANANPRAWKVSRRPGAIHSALYQPVWTSAIRAPRDFGLALVSLIALMFWKSPPWLVVLGSATLGGLLNNGR